MELPGIIFEGTTAPIVDSDNADYYLEFDKTDEYFAYYDNRVQFYKKTEALVRKHKFIQRVYPKYLKEIVGLNTCQLMPGIEADDKNKVKIEMHHGPILTLFDVVEIVTSHMINNREEHINTFSVANKVVEEHRLNRVGVMFLCKSAHQKVHDEGIYLNYKHAFGDVNAFLQEYSDGVDKDMRMKINDYIAWSMENDSTDNNIFELYDTMKTWGNNDFSDALD